MEFRVRNTLNNVSATDVWSISRLHTFESPIRIQVLRLRRNLLEARTRRRRFQQPSGHTRGALSRRHRLANIRCLRARDFNRVFVVGTHDGL